MTSLKIYIKLTILLSQVYMIAAKINLNTPRVQRFKDMHKDKDLMEIINKN